MHRAGPHANRPSPRSRGHRDSPPRGGPASRPGIWIGSYRIHALDVIAVVLGIVVLLAIALPQ